MAWRPNKYLIDGELDNTKPGKVTGWMRFIGKRNKVRFDLDGDFHRDIRGTRIRFKGDVEGNQKDAAIYMKGFSSMQKGNAGDMTAGFEPADYVKYCYLEWYSQPNGRVVIELERDRVEIIGLPIPADKCEPVSRQKQAENMTKFLCEIVEQFGKKR